MEQGYVPIATHSVTLYAPQEAITDPSGAGVSNLDELFEKSRDEIQTQLEQAVNQFTESGDWSNLKLRSNVQPIT